MNKHLQMLLLMLLTVNLKAQSLSQLQVVGKGEYLPSELISKDIRDSNGEVCAAVVISTDLDGLSFQSYNGIVKKNSNPGRHFIFVSPTERVVEVFKTGYKPLKIILNDYGIILKSGETWGLEITGSKISSDLIPISVLTEPRGGEVFVDGESKGFTSTLQESKGKHEIKISKSGYSTITEMIDVSENNILFSYKFKIVSLITATIKSVPSEATIIVDGVEEGKTDDQLFKYPGKYKLRLTKSGFLDVEKDIEILEKGNNIFLYNLEKNTTTLNLQITPITAKVLINKKEYSNITNIELAPGKYQLDISQSGYEPLIEYVELKLGESTTKNYNLIQYTGNLQFKVKPIEAKVTLNQNGRTKYEWSGAKILNDIPVGEYEIHVSKVGYESETETIIFKVNETTLKNIVLNEKVGKDIYVQNINASAQEEVESPLASYESSFSICLFGNVLINYFDGYLDEKADSAFAALSIGGYLSFGIGSFEIAVEYSSAVRPFVFDILSDDKSMEVANLTINQIYYGGFVKYNFSEVYFIRVGAGIYAGGAELKYTDEIKSIYGELSDYEIDIKDAVGFNAILGMRINKIIIEFGSNFVDREYDIANSEPFKANSLVVQIGYIF